MDKETDVEDTEIILPCFYCQQPFDMCKCGPMEEHLS